MRREAFEEVTDAPPGRVVRSFGSFAQQVLELGEDLLDWAEPAKVPAMRSIGGKPVEGEVRAVWGGERGGARLWPGSRL